MNGTVEFFLTRKNNNYVYFLYETNSHVIDEFYWFYKNILAFSACMLVYAYIGYDTSFHTILRFIKRVQNCILKRAFGPLSWMSFITLYIIWKRVSDIFITRGKIQYVEINNYITHRLIMYSAAPYKRRYMERNSYKFKN